MTTIVSVYWALGLTATFIGVWACGVATLLSGSHSATDDEYHR